jgi:cyclopropane-fatty-acyl-phospholipid synthase
MADAASPPLLRNSGVHYDTQPRIFELLLDRNMNYSSGYYPRGDESLDAGQVAKLEHIGRSLSLARGDRMLDVGCGWSGPALYYAEHHRCRVTGVTLSDVQRDYGLAWAARRAVHDDYRIDLHSVMDLPYADGSFDHILFLESIIHMPEKDEIFARCLKLLRPGGRILIQESCYDRDSMRERYLADRGFEEINRAFGFTGDMVSGGEMLRRLEEAGFHPLGLENISTHYIRTLSQWLQNLDRHAEEMQTVSKSAYRMLRQYLMLALATYRSGHTLCHLVTAARPAA